MSEYKYIVLEVAHEEGICEIPFTFPKMIPHNVYADEMRRLLRWDNPKIIGVPKVVAAGFVDITTLYCHGYSETLKIGSRKDKDKELFKNYTTPVIFKY